MEDKITTVKISNKFLDTVEEFHYLPTTLTNHNYIHEQVTSKLQSGNACYMLYFKMSCVYCC